MYVGQGWGVACIELHLPSGDQCAATCCELKAAQIQPSLVASLARFPCCLLPPQEAERLGGTAHAAAAAEDQQWQEQLEEEEEAAKELAIENSLRTVGEAYVGVKHTQVRGSGADALGQGQGQGRDEGKGRGTLLKQAALL